MKYEEASTGTSKPEMAKKSAVSAALQQSRQTGAGFLMILAPMDDVTDVVFREIVADCAKPDLFFTEFVNVEALCSAGRETALRRLMVGERDKPLIAQIWGKNPDNFEQVADQIASGQIKREVSKISGFDRGQGAQEKRTSRTSGTGSEASTQATQLSANSKNQMIKSFDHYDFATSGFCGVDLNFGCPDKKVVKNNTGGGTIQVPDQAVEIIEATKRGLKGRLPISVKTRIGMRDYDEDWIRLLLGQDIDMLTIHFRTVREMSKYPARWEQHAEQIRKLRDEISPNTLIVGNGDVDDYNHAKELADKYGYDGIMIARGIFHDPYVFSSDSPWQDMPKIDKINLYKKHLELFKSTYPNGDRKFDPIKKFCKIYINNFDGASDMRAKLMSCKSVDESLELLQTL